MKIMNNQCFTCGKNLGAQFRADYPYDLLLDNDNLTNCMECLEFKEENEVSIPDVSESNDLHYEPFFHYDIYMEGNII